MAKGTAESGAAIAAQYEKTLATTRQLITDVAELEKLIFRGENESSEKLGVVKAIAGAVSVVSRTLAGEAAVWQTYAEARKRR